MLCMSTASLPGACEGNTDGAVLSWTVGVRQRRWSIFWA
ncbi:hypothetical protein M3J09_001703 [Ascochyta lentis]